MFNLCTSFYNMRSIVVVMLVITMCYPVLINTAAVRSSETLEEQLLLKALASTSNTRISRSTENSEEEDAPKRYCYNTPCGWAVYTYVRTIEYYMRNTCECPESYKCVRAGDDLSASAYVYRCRQNTTANNIEFPEDAN